MRKKYTDVTPADKAVFLEATKESFERDYGIPWSSIEPKILADIEVSFDDDKFVKMDPDFRIDAAYARKEFGDKKPELIDYLLWTIRFVTKSDYVEW